MVRAENAHRSVSEKTFRLLIEKGVPLPHVYGRRGVGAKSKWPWAQFAVGDSAIVPSLGIARAAFNWAERNGRKFIQKKARAGLRIWRVV